MEGYEANRVKNSYSSTKLLGMAAGALLGLTGMLASGDANARDYLDRTIHTSGSGQKDLVDAQDIVSDGSTNDIAAIYDAFFPDTDIECSAKELNPQGDYLTVFEVRCSEKANVWIPKLGPISRYGFEKIPSSEPDNPLVTRFGTKEDVQTSYFLDPHVSVRDGEFGNISEAYNNSRKGIVPITYMVNPGRAGIFGSNSENINLTGQLVSKDDASYLSRGLKNTIPSCDADFEYDPDTNFGTFELIVTDDDRDLLTVKVSSESLGIDYTVTSLAIVEDIPLNHLTKGDHTISYVANDGYDGVCSGEKTFTVERESLASRKKTISTDLGRVDLGKIVCGAETSLLSKGASIYGAGCDVLNVAKVPGLIVGGSIGYFDAGKQFGNSLVDNGVTGTNISDPGSAFITTNYFGESSETLSNGENSSQLLAVSSGWKSPSVLLKNNVHETVPISLNLVARLNLGMGFDVRSEQSRNTEISYVGMRDPSAADSSDERFTDPITDTSSWRSERNFVAAPFALGDLGADIVFGGRVFLYSGITCGIFPTQITGNESGGVIGGKLSLGLIGGKKND